MEQYDVRWFEEPVVPEDLEVMIAMMIIIILMIVFIYTTIVINNDINFLCGRVTDVCKPRQLFQLLEESAVL